jgi:hypothetical protein
MIPSRNSCRGGVGTVNNGLSAMRPAERYRHRAVDAWGPNTVGGAVLLGLPVLTGVEEVPRE